MQSQNPRELAQLYHHKMEEAFNASQKAYFEGRKADAKIFSDQMKQYRDLMKLYGEKAKEITLQQKKDNIVIISPEMEKLLIKEYKNLESKSYNLIELTRLSEQYGLEMKINFQAANDSWKLGFKAESKTYSERGKAYKILVHLSSENLKELKKNNVMQKQKMNEIEIKALLSTNIEEIKWDQDFDPLLDEREIASFFAESMKNQYNLSQQAWNQGNKAAAKKYSEMGNEYKEQMNSLNTQAAKHAYVKNNKEKTNDELDLHGLTVEEAQYFLEEKISLCLKNGMKEQELNVIVGKGLHSKNEGPKLKDMVKNFAMIYEYKYEIDPKNDGCIILKIIKK